MLSRLFVAVVCVGLYCQSLIDSLGHRSCRVSNANQPSHHSRPLLLPSILPAIQSLFPVVGCFSGVLKCWSFGFGIIASKSRPISFEWVVGSPYDRGLSDAMIQASRNSCFHCFFAVNRVIAYLLRIYYDRWCSCEMNVSGTGSAVLSCHQLFSSQK